MSDGVKAAEWVLGVLTSTTAAVAAWGAMGGATNALVTEMRWRDAARHVLLGALIAPGAGGVGAEIVAQLSGIEGPVFRTGAAAGPFAYLAGVFGPALIELGLAKIRGHHGADEGSGKVDPKG